MLAACVLVGLPACKTPSPDHSAQNADVYAPSAAYPVAEVMRGLRSPDEILRRSTIDRVIRDGAKAQPLLPDLTRMLASRKWDVVKTGTLALGALGPLAAPALPALFKAVSRHQRIPVRSAPQRTPPQMPPTRGRRPPKHLLNRSFRATVSWTLSRIGEASAAPLIKASRDPGLRHWAVNALARLGNAAHTAGPALVSLLRQQLDGRRHRSGLATPTRSRHDSQGLAPPECRRTDRGGLGV